MFIFFFYTSAQALVLPILVIKYHFLSFHCVCVCVYVYSWWNSNWFPWKQRSTSQSTYFPDTQLKKDSLPLRDIASYEIFNQSIRKGKAKFAGFGFDFALIAWAHNSKRMQQENWTIAICACSPQNDQLFQLIEKFMCTMTHAVTCIVPHFAIEYLNRKFRAVFRNENKIEVSAKADGAKIRNSHQICSMRTEWKLNNKTMYDKISALILWLPLLLLVLSTF